MITFPSLASSMDHDSFPISYDIKLGLCGADAHLVKY